MISTDTLRHFQPDYTTAKAHFLAVATKAGTPLAHPVAHTGPHGETLASHSLWLGPEHARRVLVLLSGTHGVEGLCGSALQCDLLAQLHTGTLRLPADTACLMVHLLNPWGCAWLRRCDQQGIDLNRNFMDFSKPLPDNPGYTVLRDQLFNTDAAARRQALHEYAERYGRTALEIAVSGGQYHDPAGPFYGGTAPAEANLLIRHLMARYALAQRQLAVIDLHTGLGPYGYGEIICDHPLDSAGTATAQQWYGEAVTLPAAGTSSSVPKEGLLDYAWHRIMGAGSCFVTLEFGTYSTDQLFDIILADHQLHRHGLPPWQAPETQRVKSAMQAHFCPARQQWQELAVFRTRQVVRLALAGLAHPEDPS
ncbi:DUF2817 domain-containing protein [Alcanivorax quisquiliarum]|uniref:M14 family metallopeptidase n=1 Tax=Alcanivorax quisquiliarum TaxID=2933565 RepID=A0ABT0E6Y4_9GAMM|nr:M14 family metallopeptidase [Alcanivorax quisquiliarum]